MNKLLEIGNHGGNSLLREKHLDYGVSFLLRWLSTFTEVSVEGEICELDGEAYPMKELEKGRRRQ